MTLITAATTPYLFESQGKTEQSVWDSLLLITLLIVNSQSFCSAKTMID
jgi:hypothetical protein